MPPLVLLVLDGWGLRPERKFNAIALAKTPTYDHLIAAYPHTELAASGIRVGLPEGQMGNSEVGHSNMGAGRVVYQDLTRIDKAITDGDFFENEVLLALFDRCQRGQHSLHLIGLVSDGGVHSHLRHVVALLELARQRRVERVYLHPFTDGRDSSPTGSRGFIGMLKRETERLGRGEIATISGRYYAMDRDKRWDRTKLAYDALVSSDAPFAHDALTVLERAYGEGVTDEFITPHVLTTAAGEPIARIKDGDSVFCFNFRADRVRQLTAALTQPGFDGFERREFPQPTYGCMTDYDKRFGLPVAFSPQEFIGHFGEAISAANHSNLRLAETEKYAHVTYFFNCGNEQPYPREDRLLIPSPKVPTYDLLPAMSASGIADALVTDVRENRHDVIICNFANADMVGHTGNLEATITAVETLDRCIGRVVQEVLDVDGTVVLTADHGNCEQLWDAVSNGPHTAHTSNPVPLIVIKKGLSARLRSSGALCDVAPTLLTLLKLRQPKEMTGETLLV